MARPPLEYLPRTLDLYIGSVLLERRAEKDLKAAEEALRKARETRQAHWRELKSFDALRPGVYTSKLGIPGGPEHAITVIDCGAGCIGDYPEVTSVTRLERP